MAIINPNPGQISSPNNPFHQAKTNLEAHFQTRLRGATVEAGRTPIAPRLQQPPQGLAAANNNRVRISATRGRPQMTWSEFNVRMEGRGISEDRAKVLYEHYRMGNDVAGSRMLHRRGQINEERYRNTATMMHSTRMTWEGEGNQTTDLGLLYANDKGNYAKHHLEGNGRIYNPMGVQEAFRGWDAPRANEMPKTSEITDREATRQEGNAGPQRGEDRAAPQAREEQAAPKTAKKKPKFGGKTPENLNLFGGENFLAALKSKQERRDASALVNKMEQKDEANNKKAMPTRGEQNITPSGHDMQSNFAWLLGAMHNGEIFEMVGPLSENSILRGSSLRTSTGTGDPEASALLREVRALLSNGYEVDTQPNNRGTAETDIIILRPAANFDPTQVTLEGLEQSAPNTPPSREELLHLERIGAFDLTYDRQPAAQTLTDVGNRMGAVAGRRDELEQQDRVDREVARRQAARGQAGDAQPAAVQPGPAQPGPAQPGPAQPDPAQPGPAQPGPAQPGPAQPGPAQPGPAQPGPVQPGPAQPRPGQPPAGAPNNPFDVTTQDGTVNGLDRTGINS